MGKRDVTFTNFQSDLELHAGPGKHGGGGGQGTQCPGAVCVETTNPLSGRLSIPGSGTFRS